MKLAVQAANGQAAIDSVRDTWINQLNAANTAGTNPTTGTLTNNQYFAFKDARTGATATDNLKVAQSGYAHSVKVTKTGNDEYKFEVKKVPSANNGVAAGDMPAVTQVEETFTLKK